MRDFQVPLSNDAPVPEEIQREQSINYASPAGGQGQPLTDTTGQRGAPAEGEKPPDQPQPQTTEAPDTDQEPAPPKFFESAVAPVAQHRFASAVPPERIPPPPPLDHDRYLTDPSYAKAYMEAIALYQAAVAEATRKQIEARLARYEMASLGPAVNSAFAKGVSPFLEGFQTEEEKKELVDAVLQARDAALRAGELERMADPSFWAAVAAAAAARSGALFKLQGQQRHAGLPARSFPGGGGRGPAGGYSQPTYQMTDEERRLAAEFGLTEEEWIRNVMEGV